MDARAAQMFDLVPPMIETLLAGQRADYGVLPCGWLALDVDTFAMDNGGTVKEGVGRTYAGVDGYCPLAAYLGSHGFCLDLALRPGVQHSASETEFNFECVIPMAQRLSAAGPKAPILVRLDSDFDSARLTCAIRRLQPPWIATGGFPRQVEPALDRRGGPGGTAGRRLRHALGASARASA